MRATDQSKSDLAMWKKEAPYRPKQCKQFAGHIRETIALLQLRSYQTLPTLLPQHPTSVSMRNLNLCIHTLANHTAHIFFEHSKNDTSEHSVHSIKHVCCSAKAT